MSRHIGTSGRKTPQHRDGVPSEFHGVPCHHSLPKPNSCGAAVRRAGMVCLSHFFLFCFSMGKDPVRRSCTWKTDGGTGMNEPMRTNECQWDRVTCERRQDLFFSTGPF